MYIDICVCFLYEGMLTVLRRFVRMSWPNHKNISSLLFSLFIKIDVWKKFSHVWPTTFLPVFFSFAFLKYPQNHLKNSFERRRETEKTKKRKKYIHSSFSRVFPQLKRHQINEFDLIHWFSTVFNLEKLKIKQQVTSRVVFSFAEKRID